MAGLLNSAPLFNESAAPFAFSPSRGRQRHRGTGVEACPTTHLTFDFLLEAADVVQGLIDSNWRIGLFGVAKSWPPAQQLRGRSAEVSQNLSDD